MDFDGAVSKEGVGAGVWLHNHKARHSETHSYKVNLQCTNSIAEYEALMLNLNLLKKLGAKRIMVREDSNLLSNKSKVSMMLNTLGLELLEVHFFIFYNV